MLNILIVLLYAAAAAIAGGATGMWFALPISQGMMLSLMFAMLGGRFESMEKARAGSVCESVWITAW